MVDVKFVIIQCVDNIESDVKKNWEWFQEPFDSGIAAINNKEIVETILGVHQWVGLLGDNTDTLATMLGAFCISTFQNFSEEEKDYCVAFAMETPVLPNGEADSNLFDSLTSLEWIVYHEDGSGVEKRKDFLDDDPVFLLTALLVYIAAIFNVAPLLPGVKPSEMVVLIVETVASKEIRNLPPPNIWDKK